MGPPFTRENDDEIIDFEVENWDYISSDTKDLIKKVLRIDIKKSFCKRSFKSSMDVNLKNKEKN